MITITVIVPRRWAILQCVHSINMPSVRPLYRWWRRQQAWALGRCCWTPADMAALLRGWMAACAAALAAAGPRSSPPTAYTARARR
jgi:hypothetical protein